MLRFLADENFNHDILRGVLLRNPNLDIVTVQDMGLVGTEDPIILDGAARHVRLVLTHDVATMPGYAYQRAAEGLPMPGVIAVKESAPIGLTIDDILLWPTQVRLSGKDRCASYRSKPSRLIRWRLLHPAPCG